MLQVNPLIRWVTAGASNQEGVLRLTVRERDDSSNFLLSAVEAARQGFRQVEVRVTTVSKLVAELNLPASDITKIDAEGLDLKVLEGCETLLGRTDLFFVEAPLLPKSKGNAFVEVVEYMKNAAMRYFT